MKHLLLSSYKRAFILSMFLLSISGNIHSQWTQQVSGTSYDLNSLHFLNSLTGFMGSSRALGPPGPWGGEVLRTSNGGDNWQRVLLDSNFRVKGFWFLDNNTGFVVGGYYTKMGRIFKTTNSGLNWFNITPLNFNSYLWNIMFYNNIGYAGGSYGVFKTTNSGNNWSIVLDAYPTDGRTWGKIFFNDVNTGFYSKDSIVYKTVNGGANWNASTLTSVQFRDIKFTDNNTGYVVGDNGVIFKTVNQGASWNLLNSGTSQNLFSVFFTDLNNGYITTEHTVLKTTNAGNNWFAVFNFPVDSLFSSFFVNVNTGYVCGDEGRVYKTTTGGVIGINPISTEVPKNFSLHQNYPNPFNPTTNIRFAIAKASNVKLTVFDMVGREVEVLVNENVSPGTYEVKWNADKFSSGVYFYRIITNDFSDVKKMSVIK